MINSNNYLLGIDLGTTNIKAIILAESGVVVASASKQNSLIFPGPNMVEQDAGSWWDNTVEILQTITASAGPEIVKKIRCIAVSSQTITLLPLDKDGNVIRNALIWMDNRSGEELQYITDCFGLERYISIIGAQPDVAFLPNKILWYRKHEPVFYRPAHT